MLGWMLFYAQVEKQALHRLWLTHNAVAPGADVRPWLWPWSPATSC
jgi:hypothetical protein